MYFNQSKSRLKHQLIFFIITDTFFIMPVHITSTVFIDFIFLLTYRHILFSIDATHSLVNYRCVTNKYRNRITLLSSNNVFHY